MLRYGWSLNEGAWSDIRTEAFPTSWKRVSFKYDSSELIPESRGVYIVVLNAENIIPHEPFKSFSSPLYIGHTTKLRQRFKQHSIGNRHGNIQNRMMNFNNCMYFHYSVLNGYTVDVLKYLEQSLIDVFGPPLNSINSISPGVRKEHPIEGQFQPGEL